MGNLQCIGAASIAVAVAVLLVAIGAGLMQLSVRGGSPTTELASSMAGEIVRQQGAVLSEALQAATRRADTAVAERERAANLLSTCERDLKQRDEYLAAAAPEVRRLQAELREAHLAIERIEAYFGAAAVAEAQRQRGWLRRALGTRGGGLGMELVG